LSGNVVLSVVVFALLMILSIYIFYINKTTKKIVQQIVFKMPGLGRILQEAEIARMGSVLSSLIKSGIGLTESIKLLESATQLTAYRKFYKFISYYLEKGYTLELIFVSYAGISKLLPLYPRQLILNGEKSCTLDSSFERVSEIYAKKNQLSLKDINTIFEPVMMIIVFIGVAIFSISVILPIYSILGNITDLSSGNSVNQAPQINNQTTKNTNLNTDVNKLK
jgi:type IV pilus assembly protein PilC